MALCYKAEMDSEAAAERLQVIRTLMERSAVYRRALAPIMLFLGVLGIVSSVAGTLLPMNTPARFLLYWLAISVTGLAGAFVLARREALRDKEAFWSPPTRRVAQALFPPLVTGGIAGVIIALSFGADKAVTWALPVIWIFFLRQRSARRRLLYAARNEDARDFVHSRRSIPNPKQHGRGR